MGQTLAQESQVASTPSTHLMKRMLSVMLSEEKSWKTQRVGAV